MAEQNINPGIQALQKAGYTPEQIGQFGQIYNQRANQMAYGQEVPKMYVPTQDDNASIIQEFSRSITNATLPTLAKGITLIPQVLTNAAGFAPQALDEWTNDIIKSIDQNYTGYVNPMHSRGMFEKNEKGEWGITDARSILNGFGSGIGSLATALALGSVTGTGAAGVVTSAALMALPELWKSGQEAGLADIDNARMSLVLAPIIGGLELVGGLETGLLKSAEKKIVGELAEGVISRGLKSAGLKESLELIGKSVPDEAMFKDATAASIRKLSTWGAKFASGKTVKQGFGESKEEYLQNFVTKAGEQIYDTWFSEAGAKPGQGQYGTELFVPETDQRAIGPSFLGVSYNKDEFYDDLQSAIYGGILGHGMSAITTPVVNQSMYGYIDVAVKKGRADGAIQQMSGLIQQNIQEGRMTEEQGKQAMTTATNMVGLANLLKNTPVTTTPTLRYAVYDNQYNKIPKYNQVTQGFEDAAKGLSAMLEDNMAGIAQVAALQDEVKRMYPEYKKSQLRTQVTNNFIRSIVTKGQPTDLEGQLAEIDKMQFDIMEDDAFKDLMRGYMLALPQIGSESRGFEPPAGPPSVPPAGGTPPPAGGGGAAPSGTTPPTGGATPPPGTPPTGTTPPSETPPTKPVEESGQMAPAGKPQTWVQAMGAPVLFRGQEGTIVYDDTDGYLFIPEETSNEVVITKDSSQNPADLGIEFTNTYNPIEYAVQEQTTDEGVLRPEQPQVELQQMGKGDQEYQVPTQEGQEEKVTDKEEVTKDLNNSMEWGYLWQGDRFFSKYSPENYTLVQSIIDNTLFEISRIIEDFNNLEGYSKVTGKKWKNWRDVAQDIISRNLSIDVNLTHKYNERKGIYETDAIDLTAINTAKEIVKKYDIDKAVLYIIEKGNTDLYKIIPQAVKMITSPTQQITDEKEKQPMLEGLPDGGQQEEGGQEGAELRPEAEEESERLSNITLKSSQGEIKTGQLEDANLVNIDKVVAKDEDGDVKIIINADKLNGVLLARNGKVLFRAMQGRLFVIAKVGQFYIPFYQSSSGTSGKNRGQWYPFFGYNNWLVKGRVGSSGEMEYSKKIDDVTKLLNDNLKLPSNKDGASYLTQFGQIISGGTPANPTKVLYDINEDLGYESWFVEFDRKKGNKYSENEFVADRTGFNPYNVINDGKGSVDLWIKDIVALTEDANKASSGIVKNSNQAEEKVLTPEAPQAIADMQQELEEEIKLKSGFVAKKVSGRNREGHKISGYVIFNPEDSFYKITILKDEDTGEYGLGDTNLDFVQAMDSGVIFMAEDNSFEIDVEKAFAIIMDMATPKLQQSQPPTQQIDNEAEAIISGEDRESSQGLDSLGASLEGQGAAGAAEAGGVRPEAVQQPGSEGQGATGGEQVAEGERKGEPAANRQDFIQTASEGGVGQAAPEIKERYDSSTKYVSEFDEDSTLEKVLPEGSKRRVKVMLGEASAVAPSHSPFTFVSTPGFPKNESGQNINTTDYSEYKNTQLVAIIATNFDSRALDDIPFVKDGIVYSGNNRAMSRQLAATQGTDAAYISALRQQARRLGFTEEQINSLKHPFVWMEIQDDIKPTSEEYAKYNQPREKQQDPIAEAVAMGKKVNQSTLKVLGDLMGRYDTFNQFASSKDAADFIKGLIDIKLINYQMAMSFIDESGKVNDKGKTFLRSMLLGNVLSEDNVRKFSEEGFLTYTNRIMNAISELSWNLGKEAYSILADVNDALKIQKAIMDIQAKTPGAPYEGALQAYLNQRTIGEKIMSPNAILLNVLLNKGDKDFKMVMNEYIQKADEASKGAFDMFAGPAKVVSKDEIIADIMKAYMEGSKLTDIEKGVINSYAGFIKEQAAGGGKAVINEVDNAAQADQVKAKANNIANKYKKC